MVRTTVLIEEMEIRAPSHQYTFHGTQLMVLPDADGVHGVHLVLDERDQRAEDHRHARAAPRRQLFVNM
jgi:hypothetical protein